MIEVPSCHVFQIESYLVILVAGGKGHDACPERVFLFQLRLQSSGEGDGAVSAWLEVVLVLSWCGKEYLVHISPRNNRRVVIVLTYHLHEVLFAVVVISWRVGHKVYDWNLFPCHDAQSVAFVEQGVVLWIV